MPHGWSTETVMQECRVVVRRWLASPMFVVGVVGTLGIGIGATMLMGSILDALLLRPPAHLDEPDRVARLFVRHDDPIAGSALSPKTDYPTLLDLRETPAFSDVAGVAVVPTDIGPGADVARGMVAFVTSSYFAVVGTRPVAGRFFTPDADMDAGQPPVAVLSHGYWHRRYGGDRSVIGGSLLIGGMIHTVIGIAPPGFTGLEQQAIDLWVPLSMTSPPPRAPRTWMSDRGSVWLSLAARLRPGVSREAAGAAATVVARRRRAEAGVPDTLVSVVAASTVPGRSPDRPAAVDVALWLGAVALLVLLLAGANAMVVVLARWVRLRGEMAVRLALGARATHLARGVLIEAALLAMMSSAVALGVLGTARPVVEKLLLPDMVWPAHEWDARILLASAAIALTMTLAMGLLPMRQALRGGVTETLYHPGGRGTRERSRTNRSAIGFQAAVCTVLVFGALAFARSLHRVQSLDLGVDADRTLVVTMSDRGATPRSQITRDYEEARRIAATIEGVDGVAVAEANPYMAGRAMGVFTEERDFESLWRGREAPYVTAVDSGFFAAVGARSLHGRDFAGGDRLGSPRVVIINRPLASLLWPGERAVGKTVRLDDGGTASVVGVLDGVWKFSLLDRNRMTLYLPLAQDTAAVPGALLIHVRGDVGRVEQRLLRMIVAARPDHPPPVVRLLRDQADPTYRPWRLGAAMFGAFGAIAVLVATIGLYSLVAFTTTLQRREIGVRVALGARPRHILAAVTGGNLAAVAAGGLAGTLVVLLVAPWSGPLLYETSPHDPTLLAVTTLVLLVTALAASALPIRRELQRPTAAILKME